MQQRTFGMSNKSSAIFVTSHFLLAHNYIIEQKMTSITLSYRESCMSEHMRRNISCDLVTDYCLYILYTKLE